MYLLKNNIIAVKKYNSLEIKNKIEETDYKIKLDSTIKTRFGNISIIPSSNLTNNYICYLNSNEIKSIITPIPSSPRVTK